MVHFRLNELYNLRFLVGAMAGRSNLGTCVHVVSCLAHLLGDTVSCGLRARQGGAEF